MKLLIDSRVLDKKYIKKINLYEELEIIVLNGLNVLKRDVIDVDIIWGWINPQILIYAKKLCWLHLPSAGVEPYNDINLYANKNIILTKSSGVNGIAISEHALCMMLMISRQFGTHINLQQRHVWGNGVNARTLSGAIVTILGTGDIGTAIAKRIKSFGCYIRGYKYALKEGEILPYFNEVYARKDLANALVGADYLCICLPETPETERLIGENELNLLNKGAIVINVGRGNVIHTSALVEALESGQIFGAGLDVTNPEPLDKSSPLWDMQNVIITPHTAPRCEVVYRKRIELFVKLLDAFMKGKELWNKVDFERKY